jgi:hypothetical protein
LSFLLVLVVGPSVVDLERVTWAIFKELLAVLSKRLATVSV